MSELRYHPFLDQWVITATHRQDRTFFPPPDYCPLCPTLRGGFPTEIPFPEYDIAVFENRFPSLSSKPGDPSVLGTDLTPVLPSAGVCEVVVYSQDHSSTFASLPFLQVRKLVRVWRDRYETLSARPEIKYVMIFENKGKEIGVTLDHQHGQIYGYPFIPPTMAIELESEARHIEKFGIPLMQQVLSDEADRSWNHLVWENERFIALIPFFARYPYEVWVIPRSRCRSLGCADAAGLDDFAEALLAVARKLDGLFGFSMPYVMAIKQEPSLPGYEFYWMRAEFYPPYRTADKLKYLAGSEAAAGAFINDTLSEETARTLRDVQIGPIASKKR